MSVIEVATTVMSSYSNFVCIILPVIEAYHSLFIQALREASRGGGISPAGHFQVG